MDALGMVVFHKDDLRMPGTAISGVGAVLVMTPTKSRDSISNAAFGRRITRRSATRMPRRLNAASISAKTSGATGWRDLEAVHSSAERRVKRRHLDRHIAPHTGTMHVV
jgi:hypothetical protein